MIFSLLEVMALRLFSGGLKPHSNRNEHASGLQHGPALHSHNDTELHKLFCVFVRVHVSIGKREEWRSEATNCVCVGVKKTQQTEKEAVFDYVHSRRL